MKLLINILVDFQIKYLEVDFKFEFIFGNYSEKLQFMLGINIVFDLFFLKGMIVLFYMSFKILQFFNEFMEVILDFDMEDFYFFVLEVFQSNGV